MRREIIITMDPGEIEASCTAEDGYHIYLGSLKINREIYENYMRGDQISGFLNSVVLPQLETFSREIESETNEAEAKAHAEV